MTEPILRDLSSFEGAHQHRGRSPMIRGLWMVVSTSILMRWWLPSPLRIAVLRAFGATIGRGCVVRHRVRIELPWFLTVGDHSWIGEGAWIINKAPVVIGSHVCISQGAILCAASHDPLSPSFAEVDEPITVGDGVWIALTATVLSGVTIGRNAIVRAGSVAARDVNSVNHTGRSADE